MPRYSFPKIVVLTAVDSPDIILVHDSVQLCFGVYLKHHTEQLFTTTICVVPGSDNKSPEEAK